MGKKLNRLCEKARKEYRRLEARIVRKSEKYQKKLQRGGEKKFFLNMRRHQ